MDRRSKKFVFVPFCLMAQAYQAQGIVKYDWTSSIKPFMQLLLDYEINIIQMPCAESTFEHHLYREPQGIQKYDTEKFNDHCEKLAQQVAEQIREVILCGYQVIAILGIEQSPSCCVNYIYSNHGMQKRKGLFMQKLADLISEFDIPIIGINRKYINKSLQQLKALLEEENKEKETLNQ